MLISLSLYILVAALL